MNWIVKADFPTPERLSLKGIQQIQNKGVLTTTPYDNELVFSQELCLMEIR